jgi:hypothetical protein
MLLFIVSCINRLVIPFLRVANSVDIHRSYVDRENDDDVATTAMSGDKASITRCTRADFTVMVESKHDRTSCR